MTVPFQTLANRENRTFSDHDRLDGRTERRRGWKSRLQDSSARFQILVGVGSLSVAAIMLRLLSKRRPNDTDADLKLFGLLDLTVNLPVKTTRR